MHRTIVSVWQHTRFANHDTTDDYVSNEPALDYSAALLATLIAFGAP